MRGSCTYGCEYGSARVCGCACACMSLRECLCGARGRALVPVCA